MTLRKTKLGELIELCEETNSNLEYSLNDVKGISIKKIFIETKADMQGVSLKPYLLVRPDSFAYVTVTSRNGDKITIAHNTTKNTYIVSSSYVVFKVKNKDVLDSNWLFMYFNRPEFDRYSRYDSWGSAREVFSYDSMCDIEIELPDINTQRKFVNVYLSMLENQKNYERGLEDLKLVCDGYLDSIKHSSKLVSILPYLKERTEINKDCKYVDLVGVGSEGFIEPRGSRDPSTFDKCNIFYPRDFVYNPSVIAKGAVAFNSKFTSPKICTEEYIVFYVKNEKELLAEYLFLWLKRKETGRFLEFYHMDSVRNRVYFDDLDSIYIPIPKMEIQESIVKIYKSYYERKEINERLKLQIKNICPILIKGSIEEAKEA